MESVLFPIGFFDDPAIASLSDQYKLLLGGSATHPRMLACGVIFLTDYALFSLGLSPSTGIHLADELQRRGIAVFDRDSRAFFNLSHFHWNLTGQQAGDGSPWDQAVRASLLQVPVAVREVVMQAMEGVPARKLRTAQCPTNLLTSLPAPGQGKKWASSELLVMLATYINPIQSDGGIFIVDYDAMGAFCSLPPATVEQSLITLNACGALVFDEKTREVFLPVRMKNARAKKIADAFLAVSNARSRRVRHASRKMFARTFKRTFEEYRSKSRTCAPKEVKVDVDKDGDVNRSGSGRENDAAKAASSAAALKRESVANSKEKRQNQKQQRRKVFGVTVCDDEEEKELRTIVEVGIDCGIFESEAQVEAFVADLADTGGRYFLSQFRKWYLRKEEFAFNKMFGEADELAKAKGK